MSHPIIEEFRSQVDKRCNEEDKEFLFSVLDFAIKAHGEQKRKSGEPYVIHPVGVALRLLEKYGDLELVAAGLLHDTVEDCPQVTVLELYERFGESIGFMVDAVTKTRDTFFEYPGLKIPDRVERMLWGGMKDPRVLILKIADRENNLETLGALKDNKQIRMAFETQAIYEPLRKLLCFDCCNKSLCPKNCFAHFLKKHDFKDAKELKEYLIHRSFESFDNDMFGLIYNDTSSVIWHITDKETYEMLEEDGKIDKYIDVIEMAGNQNWFKVSFKFKKGIVMPENIKYSISNYSS